MEFVNDPVATYDKWIASIDKRVVSWPLMSNPVPTIIICVLYVCTVYILPLRLDGKVRVYVQIEMFSLRSDFSHSRFIVQSCHLTE